jgi:DNA sulfur modification protein DndD
VRLVSIELTNWSAYFGTQLVDLDVTDAAPVVLIYGENGRGKTSLLRAMLWCLYGVVRSQDGIGLIPLEDMVNTDALLDGPCEVSVRMVIRDRNSTFVLHRSANADLRDDGRVVLSGYRLTLLPQGGTPMAEQNIDDYLRGLLDPDLAGFFFFDGETLSRFEERLSEQREDARLFVRDQIERALGLPFLKALQIDLETLRSELAVNIATVAKRNDKAAQISDQFAAKRDALEAANRDLEKVEAFGVSLARDIAGLDEELAKVDDIKETFHRRQAVAKQAIENRDRVNDIKGQLSSTTERDWWFPLAHQIVDRLESSDAELALAQKAHVETLARENRIDLLRAQLEVKVCKTCGQEIHGADREHIQAQLDALLEEVVPAGHEVDYSALLGRASALRKFAAAPATVARLFDLQKDLGIAELEGERLAGRLRDLSETLAGTSVDVAAIESELANKKNALDETRETLRAGQRQVDALKREVSTLSGRLAEVPGVDDADRSHLEVLDEALETIVDAFEGFRASMRLRVEEEASKLFLHLTTESNYRGVAIGADYSLSVLDSNERPVRRISAGNSQILTMSFIGALGRSSVDEAPLVMDTPLGRLDLGHRGSILDWVSEEDRQTVILVQSGEFDEVRDRQRLGNRVGRELMIRRLSEARSEIVEKT